MNEYLFKKKFNYIDYIQQQFANIFIILKLESHNRNLIYFPTFLIFYLCYIVDSI